MTVSGPLSGLVILDLTRVLAGPYCTMVLSDLGARIIKVEAPEGDDSRRYGPFINGISGYFTAFNRGKESIVIDLKQESDRNVFERLLKPGEKIMVEPGGFLYKDASVTMQAVQMPVKTGLLRRGMYLAEMTGPGRVGIQSMYVHHHAE